jgi:hypothetical protein
MNLCSSVLTGREINKIETEKGYRSQTERTKSWRHLISVVKLSAIFYEIPETLR